MDRKEIKRRNKIRSDLFRAVEDIAKKYSMPYTFSEVKGVIYYAPFHLERSESQLRELLLNRL